MRRLAINASIDYMSKENLVPETSVIPESVLQIPGKKNSGEEKLMYKELITLCARLTPAYRVVFNLRMIDGYSHQEIASMLGISVGFVVQSFQSQNCFEKYFIQDKTKHAMFYVNDDDIEGLFRTAAENYDINAEQAADFNGVLKALHEEEGSEAQKPERKKKRFLVFWWFIVLPLLFALMEYYTVQG